MITIIFFIISQVIAAFSVLLVMHEDFAKAVLGYLIKKRKQKEDKAADKQRSKIKCIG